jgi:hypothetical protein
MRPRMLMPLFLFVAACVLVGASAVDTRANGLEKNLERKFPSDWCPIPTVFLGSFTTDTGNIKLTFATNNGYDDGFGFVPFQQKLDNVSIVEESYFALKSTPHPSCYFDETVNQMAPTDLIGKPEVPFYEQFTPLSSECPWDETNGATINATDGWIELGNFGLGIAPVSTNVVITGLTPGTSYVIHGDWFAQDFSLPSNCTGSQICVKVTVEDLSTGCVPLPTKGSTWGAIKALYKN